MKVDLDGEFMVSTGPDETYDFITTPERFAPVLPYFQELKSVENDKFTVVLSVGVPQIRGRADVATQRVEAVRGERVVYRLNGCHSLGMIDANMVFDIERAGEGARVRWLSEGVVSGTLASLAQGILLPLARRQIKSLVLAVQSELGTGAQAPGPALNAAAQPGAGLFARLMQWLGGLFRARNQPVKESHSKEEGR